MHPVRTGFPYQAANLFVDMSTNLYIIRHGEAVCNVQPIAHGMKTCEGLTERGHEQVTRLAQRLRGGEIKADVLYASTITRARQTAEPIAEALGVPIRWDDELHEKRPGEEAEGLSWQEIEKRYGPYMHGQPYHIRIPGGESWASFLVRASTALDRIVRKHEDQTIVVVAHGGVVEASFYLFLNLGLSTPTGFWTHNTSLTQWRQHMDQGRKRWFLVGYNDARHLNEV
jgi:probable phosphoglycerate mutase